MTNILKHFIFAVSSAFFITACGVSTINYVPPTLTLQVEQNQVLLDAKELKRDVQYFRTLHISKRILALKEGNIVVYEDANTDLAYEFDKSTTSVIQTVFEARSVLKIYASNNLYGFQLRLANGRWLNVIAQQSESQRLRFVYGMSTKQFNTILKQLDPNAKSAPYMNVIVFRNAHHILLAKWTTMKVDFLPLVRPLPTRLGW